MSQLMKNLQEELQKQSHAQTVKIKNKMIEDKNAYIESLQKHKPKVVDLLESTNTSNEKLINEKDNKIKELLDNLEKIVQNNQLVIVEKDMIIA